MDHDHGTHPTVLAIDDTPYNLSLLIDVLKDDYRVKVANNGEKGLRIATSDEPPDLILLDVMMPEMDGRVVLRRLKAHAITRDIPVIFVTAMDEVEDETEGLDLGAVDYIAKPFSPAVVKARVKTHLNLWKTQKLLAEQNCLLAQKENQLRLVLNGMSDALFQLDEGLRFMLFNHRCATFLDLPGDLIRTGQPARDAIRFMAMRGDLGPGDVETLTEGYLKALRVGHPERMELTAAGRTLELRQTAVGDGGVVVVASDITERKEVENAMRRAKEEAEKVAQAKSDFIAVVSHEVRTPMNGVLGMARLLLETPLLPEQKEFAQTIVTSAEALLTILNDLLDISKLEAGKLELEVIPLAPHVLFERTVNLMASTAREKDLELVCRVGEEVPKALEGDANRLRQILFNLLSNAIKFTDRGKVEVAVTGEKKDSDKFQLRLSVTDTGPGISVEVKEKLFAPYVQATAGVARKYGGTGLGLSICLRLAKLMAGEISLHSVVGRGSTFALSVPMELSDADPVEIAEDAGHRAKDDISSGPALRVLLVEDNLINRKVALGILKSHHHHAVVAKDGREALEHIQNSGSFDLVLMDRHMPVMDGIEASRRIRAMPPPVGNIPIIALTAAVTQQEIKTCLDVGMNDLVSKPIDPLKLLAAMSRAVPAAQGLAQPTPPVRTTSELPGLSVKEQAPVLDLGALERLGRAYSEETLAEFKSDFLSIGRESVETFHDAAGKGNLERMTIASHNLKSNSATMGLMQLSELCRNIELACKKERLDEARDFARGLGETLEQALMALGATIGQPETKSDD